MDKLSSLITISWRVGVFQNRVALVVRQGKLMHHKATAHKTTRGKGYVNRQLINRTWRLPCRLMKNASECVHSGKRISHWPSMEQLPWHSILHKWSSKNQGCVLLALPLFCSCLILNRYSISNHIFLVAHSSSTTTPHSCCTLPYLISVNQARISFA